jgi:SHS2 domain-containing protein
MPYQYLEDIATADAAFEAWGGTPEDMFAAAADATMNVMVEDLDSIAGKERRTIQVEAEAIDLLLFQLLQELIFYKDAERLLLRVSRTHIQREAGRFTCSAETYGEEINPDKHALIVDVKAVTLHRFRVEQTPRGWETTVILDI